MLWGSVKSKYKRTHITVFEVTKRHIGLNLTKRIPTVKAQIEIYTDTQRQVYFIFLIIKKTLSPRGILGPTALYITKNTRTPFPFSLTRTSYTDTQKRITLSHTLSLSLSLSQINESLVCFVRLSSQILRIWVSVLIARSSFFFTIFPINFTVFGFCIHQIILREGARWWPWGL